MSQPVETAEGLVLIVDDEFPIAQALAYVVEDCGLTPLLASHGKHALDLLREHQPCLIFTDFMMPQMNGRELIAALRETGKPLPPIVLMSAAGSAYIEDAGADALLPKPFDLADVEALLRRYVK